MLTIAEIRSLERQAIQNDKVRNYNQAIQQSKTCLESYLLLRPADKINAANCAHRIASCYHDLAWQKQLQALQITQYLFQATKYICKACQLDPQNKNHYFFKRICLIQYSKALRGQTVNTDHIYFLINEHQKIIEYFKNKFSNKGTTIAEHYREIFNLYNSMTNTEIKTISVALKRCENCKNALEAIQIATKFDPRNKFIQKQLTDFLNHQLNNITLYKKWAEREENIFAHITINKTLILFYSHINDRPKLAQSYHNIASNYLKLKSRSRDHKTRLTFAKDSLKYAELSHQTQPDNTHHHETYIVSLEAYGAVLSEKEEDQIEAIKYYRQALDESQKANSDSHGIKQVITFCYQNLTYSYYKMGLNTTSNTDKLSNLEKAFRYSNLAHEHNHTDENLTLTGQIGHEFAVCLSRQKQHEKALEILLESARINNQLHNYEQLTVNYDKIASIYFHQEKLDEAIEYFQKTLHIKREHNLLKSQDPTRHQLAQTYYQKATNLFQSARKTTSHDKTIINLYDQGIELSEENHEPRKASVGLYGKATFVFQIQRQTNQGIDLLKQSITSLVDALQKIYNLDRTAQFQRLNQVIVDDFKKQNTEDQTQFENAKKLYQALTNLGHELMNESSIKNMHSRKRSFVYTKEDLTKEDPRKRKHFKY